MNIKNRFRSLKRHLITTAAATLLALSPLHVAQAAPERVSIDYAYYNPVSLLLKKKGWLEEDLAKDNIDVRWTLSLGSNKALEFLRGSAIDFGSTAGSAALVAKSNGLPINSIYVYSKPEWTALVTRKDSAIRSAADLKGKSVAVTRGTDPHIFLLRVLAENNLTEKDINTVLLQHPDGYTALVRNQVDAWAGLDPHMARAELESGAVLFHRNVDLNTYGILNVRTAFAEENPELVKRVLGIYEKARHYALEHPEELRDALVEAAGISADVAARQLERTDITKATIGDQHRTLLIETGKVLQNIGIIKPAVDVTAVTDQLIDRQFNN